MKTCGVGKCVHQVSGVLMGFLGVWWHESPWYGDGIRPAVRTQPAATRRNLGAACGSMAARHLYQYSRKRGYVVKRAKGEADSLSSGVLHGVRCEGLWRTGGTYLFIFLYSGQRRMIKKSNLAYFSTLCLYVGPVDLQCSLKKLINR